MTAPLQLFNAYEQDYDAAALTDAAGVDCHLWEDGGCCFSCVCAIYEDHFGEGSSRKATDDLEAEYVAAGISRRSRQLLATLVLYGARRRMLEALAERQAADERA